MIDFVNLIYVQIYEIMKNNASLELREFFKKYSMLEREGVYFLQTYAAHLIFLMDKYKDIDRTSIIYLKADVEELQVEEIEDAIKAYSKDLKSKKEKRLIARNKLDNIKIKFLSLWEQ